VVIVLFLFPKTNYPFTKYGHHIARSTSGGSDGLNGN